jgi:RNA polymerase sigma-70 factor (ECF subfamily)
MDDRDFDPQDGRNRYQGRRKDRRGFCRRSGRPQRTGSGYPRGGRSTEASGSKRLGPINPISETASASRDLERLLLRMSGKDEAAFKELYAPTRRKLFSTIMLLVKREYLAEEILQEAYVRIWLNAGTYRPTLGSPMLWMITIARNLAIDIARKSGREIYADDAILTSFADDGPTALESIEIQEEQDDAVNNQRNIFVALQALDPAKRHLVIAAYINGESRNRLSEQYGVPVNTIKTWIRRALLEVRASLQAGIAVKNTRADGLKNSSMINCLNN